MFLYSKKLFAYAKKEGVSRYLPLDERGTDVLRLYSLPFLYVSVQVGSRHLIFWSDILGFRESGRAARTTALMLPC